VNLVGRRHPGGQERTRERVEGGRDLGSAMHQPFKGSTTTSDLMIGVTAAASAAKFRDAAGG